MAPTKRRAQVPDHVDPEKLPANVYFSRKGRGRWVCRKRQGRSRGKEIRLGDATTTLADLWASVERIEADQAPTFAGISMTFQQSAAWRDLAANTQRDYRLCHQAVAGRVTRSGVKLGDMPLEAWTPGAVRRYLDTRGEESRSRANHELRYMRRVFSWARARDYVATNPAKGLEEFKQPPRQRYVTDGEYLHVLRLAEKSGSPYLANIMELAYLCRLRLAEVLDIQQDQIQPEGLLVKRRKGSKDNIVEWNDRLRAAIATVQRHSTRWVLAGKDGGRLRESTVQTAWQRLMRQAVEKGLKEKFTPHDLKRKGVTDTEGDKLAASGHRSYAMLKTYDVLPAKVSPADFKKKEGLNGDL